MQTFSSSLYHPSWSPAFSDSSSRLRLYSPWPLVRSYPSSFFVIFAPPLDPGAQRWLRIPAGCQGISKVASGSTRSGNGFKVGIVRAKEEQKSQLSMRGRYRIMRLTRFKHPWTCEWINRSTWCGFSKHRARATSLPKRKSELLWGSWWMSCTSCNRTSVIIHHHRQGLFHKHWQSPRFSVAKGVVESSSNAFNAGRYCKWVFSQSPHYNKHM